MPSRESLLASIRPRMRLNRDFFLKVYGYSITRPRFKEEALTALEAAGCSRAREYYTCVVAEYEHERNKEVKEAAAWLVNQKRKGDVRMKRNDEEVGEWQDLLMKKRKLLQEKQQLLTSK